MDAMADGSSRTKWNKILYEEQNVPDNYVDDTFLEEMKKNCKVNFSMKQVLPVSLADLGGGVRDARPPWASKFFRFHAVFRKIWRVHAPPGGFTPPPRENPGSATEFVYQAVSETTPHKF